MLGPFIFIAFGVIIILAIVASTLYVVRQQSVAIVERFGRYQKQPLVVFISDFRLGLTKLLRVCSCVFYSQKSSLKPKPGTMCL